jgi:hypothetical protein
LLLQCGGHKLLGDIGLSVSVVVVMVQHMSACLCDGPMQHVRKWLRQEAS